MSYETSAKDLFVVVREMLNVIRSEREGSITVMRKTVRRHPERERRIYYRSEENGKTSFRVPMVRKTIRRHPERQRRIYTRDEENGKLSSES